MTRQRRPLAGGRFCGVSHRRSASSARGARSLPRRERLGPRTEAALREGAMEIATVGVVGLGTMGSGIVEVLARSGLSVVAVEVSEQAMERGRATLTGSTARAV